MDIIYIYMDIIYIYIYNGYNIYIMDIIYIYYNTCLILHLQLLETCATAGAQTLKATLPVPHWRRWRHR